MKEQLETLIELQKLDMAQEEFHKDVDAKNRKVEENKDLLLELDANLSAEKDELDKTNHLLKSKELELEETNKGLEHANEKLNHISNSRDYATVEQEQTNFANMKEQIEKEIEELKKAIEEAGKAIDEHAAEYDSLKAENDALADEAQQAADAIEGKVNELKAQSEAIAKKIRPDILQRYKFIRKRRPGEEAIVSASNGTCVGCHMKLQPQTYIRLQRQQTLECCQNCQRIIYFNAEEHVPTHTEG